MENGLNKLKYCFKPLSHLIVSGINLNKELKGFVRFKPLSHLIVSGIGLVSNEQEGSDYCFKPLSHLIVSGIRENLFTSLALCDIEF